MPPVFHQNGDECFRAATEILSADKPAFLSRIGGSDTNALVAYRAEAHRPEDERRAINQKFWDVCKRYNGYYDRAGSEENYVRYLHEIERCYRASPYLIFCNYQLLQIYFEAFIHPQWRQKEIEYEAGYKNLIKDIATAQPDLQCFPYPFVENMVFDDWNLFRVFQNVLAGKKVLVISPFAASIEANFHNRRTFFKRGYQYPEFELKLYNTPITYDGLPAEYYPHDSWFDTLAAMKDAIGKIDFDIALLSCGSYALPLGVHIADGLGRKAVYVGGILQLYFGVMGRRYENEFFTDQLNLESYIYPLEKEKYLKHFNITGQTAREAFGAYF